ncbi:MAG TPA: TIR domain-containing protein [Actinoplanes sp.]
MNFNGFISYSHAADGRLAPAVQRGLHRLAKPWHRRRALWIFRDQTGLSVTPTLWSSIQQALDDSEWFVLLASPEAAQSPWVNREIEHWIATKPADRILPVVTDGEWEWDPESGDLAADSTAVPAALRGVFAEEPLYLDMRWARDDRHLSLQHSRFRDAIAQLAAPMHGVSKDDLEGEDVRQHRRVGRLRWAVGAALALLMVAASLAAALAGRNADWATASAVEARRQQQVAAEQRGNAERSAEEAQRQQENARNQEARARAAGIETKVQEKRAREQQVAAKRAAATAGRQQQLAKRAQALAEEQRAVAEEQSELAQQSKAETAHLKLVAEEQKRIAAQATATAEEQTRIAKEQQQLALLAEQDAARQTVIAQKAAADAAVQVEEAAKQKRIALGRRLLNQAKATISNDPTLAIRLGLAAEKIQPGTEARGELASLVTSTRRVGIISEVDVLRAAYGPNNVLATVEAGFTASLWNVANPAVPVRLATLRDVPYSGEPVFSPDGKTLALIGSWNFQPVLFDVSNPAHPTLLATLPWSFAQWLSFSPDGQTLAASNIDGQWSLWDIANRESPGLLSKQTKRAATPIVFSPDGHTVAAAGVPGTVYDITNRAQPTEVATLDGEWRSATFSPTEPLLITHDRDGNLALWRMDDPTQPQQVLMMPARAYASAFSRDGQTLVTSDGTGTARLWDMSGKSPIPIASINDQGGSGGSLDFSPDGRLLVTTSSTGVSSLWTVAAHGEPKVRSRAEGAYGSNVATTLTPDGQRLITAHRDGTATVWDLSKPAGPVERATARIDKEPIDKAAVSRSGDLIATIGWQNGAPVTLTDLSDPTAPVPLGTLPDGDYGRVLAFDPQGRTLAVGRGVSDVTLWDLSNRQRPTWLADLPGTDGVSTLAFSPDGHTVAIGTALAIHLWNVADRSKPVHFGTLKGHADDVNALVFSPDGRTLASGSEDRTVALWNVGDHTHLGRQAILTGNDGAVGSVAFAPDGRTLAIGVFDAAAVLWDVADPPAPVRLATLIRAELTPGTVLLHPDGRTLITAGYGDTTDRAVFWDYSALNDLRANPVNIACAVVGGGFTPDEWALYIPDADYQPTCPH